MHSKRFATLFPVTFTRIDVVLPTHDLSRCASFNDHRLVKAGSRMYEASEEVISLRIFIPRLWSSMEQT